jgi:heat-inducible transcriptional repressor
MIQRKISLLNKIIKEYIKIAQPISSKLLADKYNFKISPATIRHEMLKLEKEGYIFQPHTSAGRIPTEKAYHFYIKNFLKNKKIKKKDRNFLNKIKKKYQFLEMQNLIKKIGKAIADLSEETVIITFNSQVYCIGLSNLFNQPEFIERKLISDMLLTIDCLDKIVENFSIANEEIQILIGKENPFNKKCGIIMINYAQKDSKINNNIFAILGPIRMNYEKNLALIKFVNVLIKKIIL